jgi:hypothetical protein
MIKFDYFLASICPTCVILKVLGDVAAHSAHAINLIRNWSKAGRTLRTFECLIR